MKKILTALIVTVLATNVFAGQWNSFVIRENGTSGAPLIKDSDAASGALEFVTFAASQKAGWGTNSVDGAKIGDLSAISIQRLDDYSRFTAGSGPAVAPYFNIWVTDGSGNYAVIANEPSNGEWQPGNNQWDMDWNELSSKVAKVYETPGWNTGSSWVHNYLGSAADDGITFADLAALTIEAPSVEYILDSLNGVGSGAPDELGTNVAYGFTWVFGDTLANYESGQDGFIVANPNVVPEPATMALLGLGGLLLRRKRS